MLNFYYFPQESLNQSFPRRKERNIVEKYSWPPHSSSFNESQFLSIFSSASEIYSFEGGHRFSKRFRYKLRNARVFFASFPFYRKVRVRSSKKTAENRYSLIFCDFFSLQRADKYAFAFERDIPREKILINYFLYKWTSDLTWMETVSLHLLSKDTFFPEKLNSKELIIQILHRLDLRYVCIYYFWIKIQERKVLYDKIDLKTQCKKFPFL